MTLTIKQAVSPSALHQDLLRCGHLCQAGVFRQATRGHSLFSGQTNRFSSRALFEVGVLVNCICKRTGEYQESLRDLRNKWKHFFLSTLRGTIVKAFLAKAFLEGREDIVVGFVRDGFGMLMIRSVIGLVLLTVIFLGGRGDYPAISSRFDLDDVRYMAYSKLSRMEKPHFLCGEHLYEYFKSHMTVRRSDLDIQQRLHH